MSSVAAHTVAARPVLDRKPSPGTILLFLLLLLIGVGYTGYSLVSDVNRAMPHGLALLSFFLLGVALLIALSFEFVNGFHDTANAVATVILQVGSGAGFAMVFALLIAAILWNLGTWYLGLPASSSHTLIGSIIGVGVANALMHGRDGTSGVDWGQATKIGYSLLLSPLVGFVGAALLFLVLKALVKNQDLYREPKGAAAPPWWIRGILILTCGGVSFAHGSNDGQKGMGLIMLILIGTVPIAYALNRAMPAEQMVPFIAMAQTTKQSLNEYTHGATVADPRGTLSTFIRTREWNDDVLPAMAALTGSIADQVRASGTFAKVPAENVTNVRNDMYLTSEAIRVFDKNPHSKALGAEARGNLNAFKKQIDAATKFIPPWVKVAVAIALGLGTMVGWKRIVVTIGERIGKTHLTYAQGASAEVVAMSTIAAADMFGLPVSTTHVLSSGVAGTMAANRSGLQWATVRNLVMAWVLTLPAAIVLAGVLYWVFRHVF